MEPTRQLIKEIFPSINNSQLALDRLYLAHISITPTTTDPVISMTRLVVFLTDDVLEDLGLRCIAQVASEIEDDHEKTYLEENVVWPA